MTEAQHRKPCAREGTRKALELKRARSKSLHIKLELEADREVLARLELLARLQPPLLRPPGARGHAMLRVRPRPRLDPPFQWKFLTVAATSTIERRRPPASGLLCNCRV